jgi:methionyl-tRNA synthetase
VSEEAEPQRIDIDRFFETQLRVARIVSAERVPNTDKLLQLQVDLGSEKRQIVAGIALAYEPEALVGKHIIVVANLEPARIRGVESQGMLLAADLDGKPIVATFEQDIPPGTPVR